MTVELVEKHISSGRLYPRPRESCDSCPFDLVLCWGEIYTNPYWKHVSGAGETHAPSYESLNHKLAKKLMLGYLSSGGKCVFSHNCTQNKINNPLKNGKYVSEFAYKDCRFDIAFVNEDNPIFGIEIHSGHCITNLVTRNEINWVEIEAVDVLHALDRLNHNMEIEFKDIAKKACCEEKEKLRTKPMKKLARELGCYSKILRYPKFKTCRLLAIKGKFEIQEVWKLKFSSGEEKLFEEFERRHRCLRCERKKLTVTRYRPYCFGCYKVISGDSSESGYEDIIRYTISDEDKLRLRETMDWMDAAMGGWSLGVSCELCGKNHCDDIDPEVEKKFEEEYGESISTYTWWFGQKKRICDLCFIKKCEESKTFSTFTEILNNKVNWTE